MPAATSQADLLAVTQRDYAKLAKLIADIPSGIALRKDQDDISIKDIIGHRAHWIDLFFGWRAAGEAADIPAKGVKWNQLPAYNAQIRRAQSGLGWDAAKAQLEAAHTRLIHDIAENDDRSLYGEPMPGGGNAWTTGRWAEAAGAAHYRSAAKYIRSRLRAADLS